MQPRKIFHSVKGADHARHSKVLDGSRVLFVSWAHQANSKRSELQCVTHSMLRG